MDWFHPLMLTIAFAAMWGVARFTTFHSPSTKERIPSRRERFHQYIAGERQLMMDWEEAFDPRIGRSRDEIAYGLPLIDIRPGASNPMYHFQEYYETRGWSEPGGWRSREEIADGMTPIDIRPDWRDRKRRMQA